MMRLSFNTVLLLTTLTGLLLSEASFAESAAPDSSKLDLVKQGEYLSKASDCEVCHTSSAGMTFAGGLAFKTPFGVIYSSNITPDKATGIGNWTEQQFSNALKHGIRADGQNLYPAMPYTSYSKLTDANIHAMYAYFMSLKGINHNPPKNEMGFPYNQRLALKGWNLINFHYKPFEEDPSHSAVWNRGKYVATALGHCEECHTPRNLAMGLSDKAYAGAMVDGWEAFNISSDKESGIGNWSLNDLMQYLRTGALPGKATTGGGMADVISHSLRFLTPEDLKALATYIKSVPAQRTSSRDRSDSGKNAQSDITQEVRGMPIDYASPSGAVLFNSNCASCHGITGQGIGENKYYPSLSQNSVVGSDKPNNLVQVILHGVDRVNGAGESIVMPGFEDNLTDAQIATLTNYVRNQLGNKGEQVDTAAVEAIRDNNVTVIPGYLLILGGVIGVLIIFAVIICIRRRRSTRT